MVRPLALSGVALFALFALLLIGACSSSGNGASGSGTAGNPCDTPGACDVSTDCSNSPTKHDGDGTFYDTADGSGNCSFDKSPNDLMIGAMNHTDYDGSSVCGACVHLTGPMGELTIRVVDQCPECKPGDIDLSPEAFAKIADPSAGRVKIEWTYVGCDVMGPIQYFFKDGSSQYWTAVQIRNHRYAIAKLEYKLGDGTYKSVEREDYNFFVDAGGMGTGPYDFRVTDVNGQVLEDKAVPLVVSGSSPGAAQFPSCAK